MKSVEKTEAPPPEAFKPFDYSQSDLKVFAGTLDHSCVEQSEHIQRHSLCIRMSERLYALLRYEIKGQRTVWSKPARPWF